MDLKVEAVCSRCKDSLDIYEILLHDGRQSITVVVEPCRNCIDNAYDSGVAEGERI